MRETISDRKVYKLFSCLFTLFRITTVIFYSFTTTDTYGVGLEEKDSYMHYTRIGLSMKNTKVTMRNRV